MYLIAIVWMWIVSCKSHVLNIWFPLEVPFFFLKAWTFFEGWSLARGNVSSIGGFWELFPFCFLLYSDVGKQQAHTMMDWIPSSHEISKSSHSSVASVKDLVAVMTRITNTPTVQTFCTLWHLRTQDASLHCQHSPGINLDWMINVFRECAFKRIYTKYTIVWMGGYAVAWCGVCIEING